MNVKRMRNLASEMFKSVNNLNPPFMKEAFRAEINPTIQPSNTIV